VITEVEACCKLLLLRGISSSCGRLTVKPFVCFKLSLFVYELNGERGPLSLVSTIEELLERINSGSGLEIPRIRP
jgi:hypothetical protein